MSPVQEHITPTLLQNVLSFWFSHLTSPHQFVAPPADAVVRWFKRDDDFDKACV
jgi:uncharacterized protein (DUF924 family)